MTTDRLENAENLDPYSSPKTFFGAELRRLREAAGLTQHQLGERVFCSRDYISRFESASRRPQPEVSRLLDKVLGSGEHLQRLCRLPGSRNTRTTSRMWPTWNNRQPPSASTPPC